MNSLLERMRRFRMYKIHTHVCPQIGRGCRESYEDTMGSYRPGCGYCDGKGSYTDHEDFTAGHLIDNVVAALFLERAFDEGYSAGYGDAKGHR